MAVAMKTAFPFKMRFGLQEPIGAQMSDITNYFFIPFAVRILESNLDHRAANIEGSG